MKTFGILVDRSNPFNEIFFPLAKKMKNALDSLSLNSHLFPNPAIFSGRKIIFGAHSDPGFWASAVKKDDIFVNFEPVYMSDWRTNNNLYCELLNEHSVIDYTARNLLFLKKATVLTVPPQFSNHPNCEKDIDILFVGNPTSFRKEKISKLVDGKLRISFGFRIFGDQLVNAIARSKIFLNINAEGQDIFNIFRYSLCCNSHTLFVGDVGSIDSHPELQDHIGNSLFYDTTVLAKKIPEILGDFQHYSFMLSEQQKAAAFHEKKFMQELTSFILAN